MLITMASKFLLCAGTWLLSDGIYSWILYHKAISYNGEHQNFWRDHWIRLVRIVLACGIIGVGVTI